MSVIVNNLTKIYKNQKAVDAISFQVGKGEILGFLGPNGAGKSTTMKIATCYIPPSSGSIKVSGFDVVENPLAVRKSVGYLPEHNPLYLDMYVHEYLQFIGSIHQLKSPTGRVKEMIGLCGLSVEQNKKIGALSKGYRQRVGLAQALIHNPEVLILDEPTTGLDPNQIVEIRNLIRNISREKTVIFSTHIMQEVQALCDRVIIINKGRIVTDSRVSDLQGMQKSTKIIEAEFDKSLEEDLLRNIEGVTFIKALGNNKFELRTEGRDIRADIFRVASENGIALLGMKQEESSLETIFRQLTNEEEQHA